MRCHGRNSQFAGTDEGAVTGNLIAGGQIIGQVQIVHVILQNDFAGFLIIGNDTGGPLDIFEFLQSVVGGTVGIDQAVHTEVSIVGVFSVVTAVPVHCLAVGSDALVDGMVTPLPHEAAANLVFPVDDLEVILQVSGAVAHGVAVFAHNVRLGGVIVQIFLDLSDGGVHSAEQVHIGEVVFSLVAVVPGGFIMGQTAGIKLLGPGKSLLKGNAVAALITHGPDDHTGAVLVPVDTALGPVHSSIDPIRIVRNGRGPVIVALPIGFCIGMIERTATVAFVVSFVNNKEAVLVAELIEQRRVGIMTGTDGGHIVLPHDQKIPLHMFQRHGGTQNGVGIMAVHATELNGNTVDVDHIVDDLDLADTDTVGDNFVFSLQHQGIQIGCFGIPEDGILYGHADDLGVVCIAVQVNWCSGGDCVALGVAEGRGTGDCTVPVGQTHGHFSGFSANDGVDKIVHNAIFRPLEQVHITENTGSTELVLVFHVAAVAPLYDQNGQLVGALGDHFGDIEFTGGVGYLAVANILAVKPDIEAGIHTFKV